MRVFGLLLAVAGLATAAQVALVVLHPAAGTLTLVTDLAAIIAALCATIALWAVLPLVSRQMHDMRDAVFWSAVAFTLFLLGDTYWALQELVFSNALPLGTLADLFWLGGDTAWIFGLASVVSGTFVPYVRYTLGPALAAAVAYTAFHVAHLILGVHGLELFIADLYPAFDFVILGLGLAYLLPLLQHGVTRLTAPWIMATAGVAIWAGYDLAYAALNAAGTYYSGHPIDILYVLAYGMFVASVTLQVSLLPRHAAFRKPA